MTADRPSALRGRRGTPLRAALAAVTTLVVLAVAAAPARATQDEPELREPREALEAALTCPDVLDAEDREPVLLVHGTGAVARENFDWNLRPQLRADGFDVCTVDLPTRALADIQVAAEYVVHAVRAIHDAGGRPVDVAGHSQGGLEPRWAMAWWPSTRAQIDDLVTFASPHDGTLAAEAACAGTVCWPAVHQMRPGSDFLIALWAREDLADVDVTSMGSVMDELVQPPETIELPGAVNVLLQDVCPARPVTHVSIVADAVAYALAVDAFGSRGAADVDRLPGDVCLQALVDEASPEHVLDPEAAGEYRDGSFVDPAIPRLLLTREEPELADYAAEGREQDPDDGEAGTDPGARPSDDEPSRQPGHRRAGDGAAAADPAGGAADGRVLPATGGGAVLAGAAALWGATSLAGAAGLGRPTRRR